MKTKTKPAPSRATASIDWSDPQMPLWLVAQSNTPCCTEGLPGCGKTQGALAFARGMGRRLITIIGSAMAPEDGGGLPAPDYERYEVRLMPMKRIKIACDEPVVILLDELTSCGPDKQAPMLTMIQDRVIGDAELHPDTIIIAACNPPSIATNGTPLTKPMANRFYHHKWKTNLAAWRAGLRGQMGKPLTWAPPSIPTLPDNWRDHIEFFARALDTFAERNPSCIEGFPEDDETLAYPTIRSFTNLAVALAACRSVHAPGEVMRRVMDGLVGPGAATEFAAWLENCDLADPEAVLAGEDWQFDKGEADKGVAFLAALWAAVTAKTTNDRWLRAMRITLDVGLVAPEVALLHTAKAMDLKPKGLMPDEQMFRDIVNFQSKTTKPF